MKSMSYFLLEVF